MAKCACFGDRIGWVFQKYFLWATIGILGLHRFLLLPRPFSVGTKLMICFQFVIALLVFSPLRLVVPHLEIVFHTVHLVDAVLNFPIAIRIKLLKDYLYIFSQLHFCHFIARQDGHLL